MIVVIPFLFTGCGGGGGAGQKVKFFLWQFSCWMRINAFSKFSPGYAGIT
jgi:hypothetical protein